MEYNETLAHEYYKICEFESEETKKFINPNYSKFYLEEKKRINDYKQRFLNIIGEKELSYEETYNKILNSYISMFDVGRFKVLRQEPYYKRIMGIQSLYKKEKLETCLDIKISNKKEDQVSFKNKKELEDELDKYYIRLNRLFMSGIINNNQYMRFKRKLEYIYNYYYSSVLGEQVPFRMLSNEDYYLIEARALNNNCSFEEQFIFENQIIRNKIFKYNFNK